MRILSQDGRIDVPYEKCAIYMFFNEIFSGNYEINANLAGNKSYKMAEYSTAEKAQKAMEMLKKAYSPLLIIKDLGNGIEADIKPNDWIVNRTEPNGIRENFYFQFPADDEIEV